MVYLNYILTLGEGTGKLLDLELQKVSDWFGLGLHLDIPPPVLHNIKHNITLHSPHEFRTEIFSVWIKKQPASSVRWSTRVDVVSILN